jgi:hypothetical protein
MKTTYKQMFCAAALVALCLGPLGKAEAQTASPDFSKLDNVRSQLAYQRGIEAALWGMPAMDIISVYHAGQKHGADWNDVIYWSKPQDAKS